MSSEKKRNGGTEERLAKSYSPTGDELRSFANTQKSWTRSLNILINYVLARFGNIDIATIGDLEEKLLEIEASRKVRENFKGDINSLINDFPSLALALGREATPALVETTQSISNAQLVKNDAQEKAVKPVAQVSTSDIEDMNEDESLTEGFNASLLEAFTKK